LTPPTPGERRKTRPPLHIIFAYPCKSLKLLIKYATEKMIFSINKLCTGTRSVPPSAGSSAAYRTYTDEKERWTNKQKYLSRRAGNRRSRRGFSATGLEVLPRRDHSSDCGSGTGSGAGKSLHKEISRRSHRTMRKPRNTISNSSFVSIRYASSSKVLPDANEHEEAQIPVIDITALRSISRIVAAIKQRIAAGETDESGDDAQRHSAGSSSGSTGTSSNCSTNINQEENR
jgi:hypothetical protein